MRHERLKQDGSKVKTANQPRTLVDWVKNKKQFAILLVAFVALLIFSLSLALGGKSQRSQAYADASGAAGLSAVVEYDCADSCENKYNFNIYILAPDGRQVSTVQPNSDGEIKLAMAEGHYIMIIGKLFDNHDTFPQEALELKNGKTLELKLRY
jgi:hypothetical protein